MKNLITYLKALWKRGLGSQRKKIGVTLGEATIEHPFSTYSAPFGTCWQPSGKLHSVVRCAAMLVMLFTIGSGNAWGDVTLEFTTGSTDGSQALTDGTRAQWMTSATKDLCTIGTVSNSFYYYSKAAQYGGPRGIKIGKSGAAGYTIFNIASGSQITSTTIVVEASRFLYDKSSDLSIAVNGGSLITAQTLSDEDVTIREYTFTFSSVKVTSVKVNASKYMYIKSITIKSAVSCGSATPSATGTASLNGSFNMTSTTSAIGVASGTWGPGTNCSWSDYGFVWSDGTTTTTPTVSNNKVQVGTSGTGTSWTGSVTPSGSTSPTSWTTGHTYYVRAYGKNNNGSATYAYGSPWSFTPRSVTFKANGGTGSDKVQYVQGGVSTNLTANTFTRTGYTFNGWNTNSDGTSGTGYTEGQSVNLGADLILFAKWTAKTTTISFNQNSGTGGQTSSKTATYGSAMPTPITTPTKEGYDFAGYYDGSGGTGTQYYTNAGASARNWDKDTESATTLYAKWTAKSFNVTWMVNGSEWSGKGGSPSVDFGSHVSTLPTAPTTSDGCGDKFMGWTTVADYVHGTSPLFTAAGDAPTISAEGDVTYYAVFADYAE